MKPQANNWDTKIRSSAPSLLMPQHPTKLMMPIQPGQRLQSLFSARDDYFYDAIVYLAEYNAEGALGFVINRIFPRTLNELVEFSYLPPFPLHEGGPVDQSHLYLIHQRPDRIQGGTLVWDGVYLGGDFTQVVEAIAAEGLSLTGVRLFVGYCGWNAGELEAEITENGWLLIDKETKSEDLF